MCKWYFHFSCGHPCCRTTRTRRAPRTNGAAKSLAVRRPKGKPATTISKRSGIPGPFYGIKDGRVPDNSVTGLSSCRYVRSWQANQKQSIPSTKPASPIPNFGQKLALTKKAPATEPTNKPAPVIFQNRAASLTRSFRTTVELCSNIDSMSSPLSQGCRPAPPAYDGRIVDFRQSWLGSGSGRRCRHRRLAGRVIAVRRRAIPPKVESQRPHPPASYGRGVSLEDAPEIRRRWAAHGPVHGSSPSTMAPGLKTPWPPLPRSPRTAPRRSSSRSAYMPPTSRASSRRWRLPGTQSAHTIVALSPPRPAHVNPHAARTDVHPLRKRRCQCARDEDVSYRARNGRHCPAAGAAVSAFISIVVAAQTPRQAVPILHAGVASDELSAREMTGV
jgi:hypothetical protein